MKMNKRKLKRIFTPYNMAIAICIIILAVSLYIIFKPETNKTPSGLKIISSGIKQEEEITEEKAKELAIKQFKKLGENGLSKDKIKTIKIDRDGEEYYYISSLNNTLEIKIHGGKITRINSASVTE